MRNNRSRLLAGLTRPALLAAALLAAALFIAANASAQDVHVVTSGGFTEAYKQLVATGTKGFLVPSSALSVSRPKK